MIDYGLLQKSIDYYALKGFNRVETPWMVPESVDSITRPEDRIPFQLKHNNKCLVASAEQGFLYLYLKNFLPIGQYQSTGVCFRNESFDFLHSKYFIKNELIKTDLVNQHELDKIVEIALNFFRTFIPSSEVVKTDIGYDIEVYGKELGSYGIRECEFLHWIYGTACSEPRFSNLIKLYGS